MNLDTVRKLIACEMEAGFTSFAIDAPPMENERLGGHPPAREAHRRRRGLNLESNSVRRRKERKRRRIHAARGGQMFIGGTL